MTEGAFPNFVIVGAQKSATRWLRSNLGHHPSVFTATTELEFFNHNWKKEPSWYYEQFKGANDASAVGEATPGYMMWNEEPARQAARIDGLLPDVRVLALLRNPIERSYSAFIHFLREGRISSETSLMEYVRSIPPEQDPRCIIAGSWYGACLQPYVQRFGERLLVLQQDDLNIDPISVYRRALRHISVSTNFLAPKLQKVRHSNPTPDSSPHNIEGGRKELLPEERRELFEYFEEDLELLSDLNVVDVDRWKL